jgi:SAM-dependent methyltransferase
VLTPRRRRGFEHLDDPATSADLRERSLRDVRLANQMLGGTNAVLSELRRILPLVGAKGSLLDVGTGLGDIPLRALERARQSGVQLDVMGLDEAPSLALRNARILDASVCGDARRLPFASESVDIVICSQVLHHFADDDIPPVLRELDRVARHAVIVSDLRRSIIAASGFWLATWPLGFHPVSRHDGVVSVLRGFTAGELKDHVVHSTGAVPAVRRHLGYRLTATWTPSR